MAVAYLVRIVEFSAAHHYLRPEWSEARNADTFGACVRDHGHTYTCTLTVQGTPDPVTGMVMDLGALDAVLQDEIVRPFDHRHLNDDIPAFADGRTVPTGEMLAMYIWERVAARLPPSCTLAVVRVQESAGLAAEFRGER